MFRPDPAVFDVIDQVSYMFHVVIGVDPIGNFTACEDLGYEVEVHEYKELGRNATMVRRPEWPGHPNELTLRWGFIIYPKMFEWMRQVEAGGDYRQHVFIIQLTMQRVPIRVYWLANAWPKSWKAASLNVEEEARMATEELVLVYDNLQMLNLGAAAVAVQLATSFEFDNDYEAVEGSMPVALDSDYEAKVEEDEEVEGREYTAEAPGEVEGSDGVQDGSEVESERKAPEYFEWEGGGGKYYDFEVQSDDKQAEYFEWEEIGDPEVVHTIADGRHDGVATVWEPAGSEYAAQEPLEHELADSEYEAIGMSYGYDLETIQKLRAIMKKRLQSAMGK